MKLLYGLDAKNILKKKYIICVKVNIFNLYKTGLFVILFCKINLLYNLEDYVKKMRVQTIFLCI